MPDSGLKQPPGRRSSSPTPHLLSGQKARDGREAQAGRDVLPKGVGEVWVLAGVWLWWVWSVWCVWPGARAAAARVQRPRAAGRWTARRNLGSAVLPASAALAPSLAPSLSPPNRIANSGSITVCRGGVGTCERQQQQQQRQRQFAALPSPAPSLTAAAQAAHQPQEQQEVVQGISSAAGCSEGRGWVCVRGCGTCVDVTSGGKRSFATLGHYTTRRSVHTSPTAAVGSAPTCRA